MSAELPNYFRALERYYDVAAELDVTSGAVLVGAIMLHRWNRAGRPARFLLPNEDLEGAKMSRRGVYKCQDQLTAAGLFKLSRKKGRTPVCELGYVLKCSELSDTSSSQCSELSDTSSSQSYIKGKRNGITHKGEGDFSGGKSNIIRVDDFEKWERWLNALLGRSESSPFLGPQKSDWARLVARWRASGELEGNVELLGRFYAADDPELFRRTDLTAWLRDIEQTLADARNWARANRGAASSGSRERSLRDLMHADLRAMEPPSNFESIALKAFELDAWPSDEVPSWHDFTLQHQVEILCFWRLGRRVRELQPAAICQAVREQVAILRQQAAAEIWEKIEKEGGRKS